MSSEVKHNNLTTRRMLLKQAFYGSGMLAMGPLLWANSNPASPRSAISNTAVARNNNLSQLAKSMIEVTVENDPQTRMRVPKGCRVRLVAKTGEQAVASSSYLWHPDPDGGATFPTQDGGWVYVSNSEVKGNGGVGAIRFDIHGNVVDSYSICTNTDNNCAGGPTPWGTWLTCEEVAEGFVLECDPLGRFDARACPALGKFKHEAVAVDPIHGYLYLTEDEPDGCFYRFKPASYPKSGRADLSSGTLQVAQRVDLDAEHNWTLKWHDIETPVPNFNHQLPTRKQVVKASIFAGGEGCWYHHGYVYFTTKHDNRVWALETQSQTLTLIYDQQTDAKFSPLLNDVDNLTVSAGGDVIVAEDGANMRMVVFSEHLEPFELVNVLGHEKSEICGPAFSPDGNRLYFSSQQGIAGIPEDGRTYELSGPFFI